MNYIEIELGGKTLKARLTLRDQLKVEERLGKNPASVLLDCSEHSFPKMGDMLVIVHQSLQTLEHGIKYDDVLEMFQEDLQNGKSIQDLVLMVVNILEASGLIESEKSED